MLKILIPCGLLLEVISCNRKAELTRPSSERITESVYASGTVKSRNQYQVYPTVTGIIRSILVSEGDTVRKGEPIIELANTSAALQQEHARLAARSASLESNGDKLNELQAIMEAAKAKMDFDALTLTRYRNLWNQGIGTRSDLDARELASLTSASSYKSARLRWATSPRVISISETVTWFSIFSAGHPKSSG